jgi:hypothetical protein
MDPVCAHPPGQRHIPTDDQFQTAPQRHLLEAPGPLQRAGRAEGPIDDGASGRQTLGDRLGIRCPDRVSKEQKRGQGLSQASPGG